MGRCVAQRGLSARCDKISSQIPEARHCEPSNGRKAFHGGAAELEDYPVIRRNALSVNKSCIHELYRPISVFPAFKHLGRRQLSIHAPFQ